MQLFKPIVLLYKDVLSHLLCGSGEEAHIKHLHKRFAFSRSNTIEMKLEENSRFLKRVTFYRDISLSQISFSIYSLLTNRIQ
jgi:hypothetical protein